VDVVTKLAIQRMANFQQFLGDVLVDAENHAAL